jgi:Right handed beta helix region
MVLEFNHALFWRVLMRLFIFCLGLFFSVSPVWAATYTVEKDGSGDFTVIQDAVDAASAGDTILIGPGRFNNEQLITIPGWSNIVRVLINKEDLTLIGSGIGNTIIGPEEPWVQGEDVDRGITGGPYFGSTTFHVEGISFENMYNGIISYNAFDLTVNSCSFSKIQYMVYVGGGGILNVNDCLFNDLLMGGTGVTSNSGDEAYISNCIFNINPPWNSVEKAVNLQGVPNTVVQGCEFEGGKIGVGYVRSNFATLTNCSFNGQWKYGISCYQTEQAEISNCILSNQGIGIYTNTASIHVDQTTFTDVTGTSIGFYDHDELTVNNCILAHGPEYTIRQYRFCDKSETKNLPHLDFTNNDWGTTDPDTIASWIKVCDYIVDYIPFLGGPVSTKQQTWDSVKAHYR